MKTETIEVTPEYLAELYRWKMKLVIDQTFIEFAGIEGKTNGSKASRIDGCRIIDSEGRTVAGN